MHRIARRGSAELDLRTTPRRSQRERPFTLDVVFNERAAAEFQRKRFAKQRSLGRDVRLVGSRHSHIETVEREFDGLSAGIVAI